MTGTNATKQLRVVYVWDADYPWDVRTEKSCLALTEAGHDVHIVARNRKRSPAIEKLPEGTVHRMPSWRWAGRKLDAALGFPAFFNPRWRSLIATTARAVHADVIIARDLPLCPTAIGVGRTLRIPVILDMAEHYPAMIRAIWQSGRHRPIDWLVRNPAVVERIERRCIRRVNHILTVAEEMTDRLVAMQVEQRRITCVANTPPLARRRNLKRVRVRSDDSIQLVYLGLLEVPRGINELIDAIALLRGRYPRISLLLIGSGRDEPIFRARAARNGLTSEDVTFAGHLPYGQAVQLLTDSDVGLLPLHRNEHMDTTIPNKLFDYMSVGLPVITSDTIPSARIVHAEHSGIVFPARSVAGLVNAIIRMTDPFTRLRMGENGKAAVARRYNWAYDGAALVATVERSHVDQRATA